MFVKYIIVVGDGMGDYPIQGKTPLEIANTPNMDRLAREGTIGLTRTIPDNMPAGSDVANLSLLGYDPKIYYKGRAPLEAASMGILLKEMDVAFRCNLTTVKEGIMADFSAGHIKTNEASEIIKLIDKELGNEKIRFYPGVSYRHLLVIDASIIEDPFKIICTPPHNITGMEYSPYLPKGESADFLISLMESSREILKERKDGNMIWLWGGGVEMDIPKLTERFNISGSVISAVDLVKGLGILAGLKPMDVPGITGYFDTDYLAKAKFGLASLENNDLVFIHIEAPDEAGHNKNLEEKIRAIENIDEKILGYILSNVKEDVRILVLSDHFTPISLGTHTNDPTPFVVWSNRESKISNASGFNEKEAKNGIFIKNGCELIDGFFSPIHGLKTEDRIR